MNTIEAGSTPERKAPQQPESPTLRVFAKVGNSYELQTETTEYKQAIKEADKLVGKGKDVLVNEKDNPNIVHVKTNRSLDVDVGREIKGSQTQGIPVRGPGEVVLASFYEKLPMDTKAFDERAKALAKAAPEQGREGVKEASKAAADPAGPGNAKEPIKKETPEGVALSGKEPKAVFDKTGYTLPDSVKGEYTVKDGKFHDRDTQSLRFEDHGKKLSTPVEDRKVIADMVEVAKAKNWGTLELKGTDTFKQIAWIEASARGMETKGYKPNERDLEELAKVKQERGIPDKPVSVSGPAKVNEIVLSDRTPSKDAPEPAKARDAAEPAKAKDAEPAKDKQAPPPLSKEDQTKLNVATRVMEKALAKLPDNMRNEAISKMTSMVRDGSLQLPTPKVTERAVERPAPAPAPAMDRSR
ncbi:hypothetical protein CR105_23170 [Massilia eurypsychrophila]|uniref:Large polyvalent protein-associated domain-containing protein n=1 Tax=Massilia eurypsychrophila TaxID=1485217 RepID=A0A2G8T9B2_9BURK|nr:LPD7 domain-containing protein [Massilia eurypsychrophila]PIL42635.1 hypothetical protein CR105_23170 [Massilia eurypsychrophila]